MEQYSNLNVHGKITQKANQADTSVEENQHDVVIVNTLNERVPSAIPEAVAAGEGMALIVENIGTEQDPDYEYVFGEAGKVDDVKIGNTSLVANKIATIPDATTSTKGVMQVGSTLEVSSGTVNQQSGVNSTTTAQGSASKTVTVTADTYGRVTAISQQDISIAASQVSSGTLASARLPDATSSSKGAVTLVYATGESGVIAVPTEGKMEEFVNSSIGTNTAYFKGTYDVETDLGLAETATQAQVITALNAKTSWKVGGAPTNNDYCFVQFDLSQDPGNVDRYDRYKYSTESTPATWVYEYTLNNSSFTADQWAAINSKISNSTVGTQSERSVDVRYIVTGPASATVDHVATFNSVDGNVVKDSSFTIATSVPSGAVFTDEHVTSSANHYSPLTVSGQDKSASASGATAAWSIDVVQGVTLNTDGKGHVTGISVTSGKIPANPNTDILVKQTAQSSTTTTYPLLFSAQSSPTSGTAYEAKYSTGCYVKSNEVFSNGYATWNTNSLPFAATDVTLTDM